MKSLFLLISSTFSFYFFCKILKYNRSEQGWHEDDVASRRVETKMEETVSGARVVRWPTLTLQKHMAFLIWYMALTFRQVNCPAISSLWESWSALTLRSPNMEVLGGVSSTIFLQPPKKSPNLWRHHGKFHNPWSWFSVAGEYCSYVLEYFSGPNNII